MPSLIFLTRNIEQNSDEIISDSWISAPIPYKKTCHDSRTSYGIDMKVRPVTKCNKGNGQCQQNIMRASLFS